MNDNICIEFKNVSKPYKELLALDDVSFDIRKGEILGYVGPNGAGKTTTIKILVGLIKDYLGKVYIYGKDIAKDSQEIHKLIGYHPQEANFQEWRTVKHTLKTFGQLSGLKSPELDDRINSILELIDLTDFQDKKIVHLSGGMFQKLRLGQALLHEPEILIMDEPLSGLDPNSRFQFKKIIKKLAKSGITSLFSSHILSDVQDVADKIAIINLGRILKIGTPEELQSSFHIGNIIEIIVAENTPLCEGLDDLPDVEYIEKIKSDRELIHLKSEVDIDLAIYKILTLLKEQRCRIRNFNLLKPSLEEVYLKYIRGGIN